MPALETTFLDAPGWLQRNPRVLKCVAAVLVVAIFVLDAWPGLDIELSVLYAIPILCSLWLAARRFTIGLTITCSLLTLWGVGEEWTTQNMISRFATVLAISVVASLGLMRLKLEREVRYVRKIALTTLRSLSEGVLTIGDQGRVRFVNRVAERMLGVSRDEIVGALASQVFVFEDRSPERPPVLELTERGGAEVREAMLFPRGGQRIPIEYTRTPIETSEGERFGEVLVFRDISARREHEDAMRRLAYRDDLTGLPNRLSLLDRFQLELAHAKRNREKLGVLYIDLDGFKDVNDAHGHESGDELLRVIAQRMRSTLRGGDTVARVGGDEFVILLPGVAGVDEARRVGQKVVASIEPAIGLPSGSASVSACVGIALYPRDGEEPEMLIRRADKAMYRAKSLGRGRVELVRASDSSTA